MPFGGGISQVRRMLLMCLGCRCTLAQFWGTFAGCAPPPLTAGREEGDFFHELIGRQLVLFAQGGARGHCVGAMAHACRATRHRGEARRGSVTIIDWEHDQGAVVTYTQRDTAWAAVQTAVGRFPHTWVVRLPDDSVRRAGGQGGRGALAAEVDRVYANLLQAVTPPQRAQLQQL